MTAPAITARQLRDMLFAIDNQNMTARDIRAVLFTLNDQDKPIALDHMGRWLNAYDTMNRLQRPARTQD